MNILRIWAIFAVAALSSGLGTGPARAEDHHACLTRDERQQLAASGKVVSLSSAIRAARRRPGEVVKARLCKGPKGYVYMLTLLARDGKVTRVAIDANATGASSGS